MPPGSDILFGALLLVVIVAIGLASYLACRALDPIAAKWRFWDLPSARKDHERPTLFTGALVFFFALLGAAVFRLTGNEASANDVVLLLGALLAASTGLVDDWLKSRGRDLGAGWKLFGQLGSAVLAVAAGVHLRIFGDPMANLVATVLWLVAVQNAWNFLDNMNGLATGLACAAALSFAAIFLSLDARDLALASAALAGLCLGFLPRNFPQARAFLGDTGTECLGFAFGVLSVAGTYVTPGGPGLLAVTVPLAVLAIPLFDMAQVIVSRLLVRQPIYRGDHRHLSHRLAAKLGSRVRAVALLLIAGLLLGAMSLFVPHASMTMAWTILSVQAGVFLAMLLFALR